MIIDFHTHAFPDALAPKAGAVLVGNLLKQDPNCTIHPVSDMTVSGLLRNMDMWNIDCSVVQPIVTKPSQLKHTNEWAQSICSDRIISFGGIYPYSESYKDDIDFVADLGLKGLKFHPEYQNFVVDDEKMFPVYDYALSKGLILLFHAGVDAGLPGPYRSSPRQFARIVDEMKGGNIIAAHLGGHQQWDDVEKYLAGKNIYLDTSMGFSYYTQEQFLRIMQIHGADRILFASDSPWSNAGEEAEKVKALPISESEKQAILGENARRLLKI